MLDMTILGLYPFLIANVAGDIRVPVKVTDQPAYIYPSRHHPLTSEYALVLPVLLK